MDSHWRNKQQPGQYWDWTLGFRRPTRIVEHFRQRKAEAPSSIQTCSLSLEKNDIVILSLSLSYYIIFIMYKYIFQDGEGGKNQRKDRELFPTRSPVREMIITSEGRIQARHTLYTYVYTHTDSNSSIHRRRPSDT